MACLGSRAMPFLRLGHAAGEITDVHGVDQLARGGVIAWRHCPVVAGCAAAPDPPSRVVTPELLKLGILVVPAATPCHGGLWLTAGAASTVTGRWLAAGPWGGGGSTLAVSPRLAFAGALSGGAAPGWCQRRVAGA
jgi:hypothetical protein